MATTPALTTEERVSSAISSLLAVLLPTVETHRTVDGTLRVSVAFAGGHQRGLPALVDQAANFLYGLHLPGLRVHQCPDVGRIVAYFPRDVTTIRCGHCSSYHLGVLDVQACFQQE